MKLVFNWSRNTAGGVAGLDGNGNLLVPGWAMKPTADGAKNFYIMEQGSNNYVERFFQNANNDYQLYALEIGAWSRIQTAGMKDVVSGIAALDASGNLLVPASQILLTRDGSDIIYFRERTAGETAFYAQRKAVSSFAMFTARGGVNVVMAALDSNGDIPHMRPKVASANLRHSNDNAESNSDLSYSYKKVKSFVMANGISGTVRVAFDLAAGVAGQTVYGRVYKNGVAIGTEQSTTSGTYVTKSEDIAFGVLAPGDTIELWIKNSATSMVLCQNFRLSYDNAADTILVAGVSTTSQTV